jgi:predicted nuclease of predicted toxin-antitoxin system
VKLLFDQNLPRRLVREFDSEFPGSAHVGDLQLDTATDPAIFAYAAEHGFTILSWRLFSYTEAAQIEGCIIGRGASQDT